MPLLARVSRRGLAVLGALALAAAGAAWLSPPAGASVFRLSVTRSEHGRAMPSNFLGLALEYSALRGEAGGTTASTVDPVFAQLIRNLTPSGRPSLRIGGLSTDRTWWPFGGKAPLGVTAALTPAWAESARALAQATNAQLLLGLNLQADRPQVDSVEAKQLRTRIGSQYISAFEVGNEPELYTAIPWYRKLGSKVLPWYDKIGTPVYARAKGYDPQDLVGDFDRVKRALASVPLAGPATSLNEWLSAFRPLLSQHALKVETAHAYGLNQCVKSPSAPDYPSVPHLLTTFASRGFIDGLSGFVARAHASKTSFRIDEMNSVSCNGRLGVSNTMASALWLVDSLFEIDSTGADGVNLHTYPNAANGLFDLTTSGGHRQASVHPIYYGALMFTQAAPAGSRLLRIHSPSQQTVRAWATQAPDHRTRVLLINDSLHSSTTAIVNAAGASGPAALERLRAGSAYATGGVTLGGVGFGARTSTGVLPAPESQSVTPKSGSYDVSLPASSAALLTFAPS